ncbi:endoplasmic reticulum Oxidoreductin 1-domain-containing protein, partial [Jimgerdemannia flammicorona]
AFSADDCHSHSFLGLHSSISIHICDEYFDRSIGKWGPNLDCFISRIGAHPERLQNVYFDYVLLLRAVTKLAGYLEGYNFCTGDPQEDADVKVRSDLGLFDGGCVSLGWRNHVNKVDRLIDLTVTCPSTFDENLMFQGQDAMVRVLSSSGQDRPRGVCFSHHLLSPSTTKVITIILLFLQFLHPPLFAGPQGGVPQPFPKRHAHHGLRRVREVPPVGQATDLRPRHRAQGPILVRRQILQVSIVFIGLRLRFPIAEPFTPNIYSPKTNPHLLQRTEIVALFNTLNRFSESIRAIGRFREMYQNKLKAAELERKRADGLERLRTEQVEKKKDAEKAK